TYTVADGNGGESTATVTVLVEQAEVAPLVANDDIATAVGTTPVTIDVLANDTGDDEAEISIHSVGLPSVGTATTDGATVEYIAATGFTGEASFIYTITDGLGNTSQAFVTVTVEPALNLPPVAEDDTATTPRNTPVLIDVLANDSDPDLGDVLSIA